MTAAEHLKPTYARNMRLIGHSDQAGRSDGQQIMVRNGYAYIGHVCSKGFSVIDVRDPTKPEAVAYVRKQIAKRDAVNAEIAEATGQALPDWTGRD